LFKFFVSLPRYTYKIMVHHKNFLDIAKLFELIFDNKLGVLIIEILMLYKDTDLSWLLFYIELVLFIFVLFFLY